MKNELLQKPPKTIMEVFQMLPEGTLAELIDDVIYMSPSPTEKHQVVIADVMYGLYGFLKQHQLGNIYTAPLDIYLDETSNAVQPDIIVVLKSNENISRKKGYLHGSPDILIEVLSPGNKDYDLVKKKELYETFGVKEYFTIDPESEQATCFLLQDGKYVVTGTFFKKIHSAMLNSSFNFLQDW